MLTLNDALNSKNVNELKELLPFFPDETGGTQKATIISRISNGLLGEQGDKLEQQYKQLNYYQQLAVAEALYDPRRQFFEDVFRAKYQKPPTLNETSKKGSPYTNSRPPSRLRLFLHSDSKGYSEGYQLFIPGELVSLLQVFVPKPPPVTLTSYEQPPEFTGDSDETLQIRLCEQEALIDLPVVLNLIQQGKLKASDKTNRASAASINLICGSLNGGDFYDIERPQKYKWSSKIGGIKAFAWPLLLQAAKLVQLNGTKLELSKSGIRQLSKPMPETLRLLWQKWQKNKLLDEFRRIDSIKGQNAKGRVMTATAPRRLAINAALQQCKVGEWIVLDDFFDFMQASRNNFHVGHDLWKLYLIDKEYGAFGYDGHDGWSILQGRYVLCLLFEYAAPLGMIDVAYVDPEDARDDYLGNWGADDLDFLSRYDGLHSFRLTALGAYCLGVNDTYEATLKTSDCRLSILPSMHINLISGKPSAEDQLLLDTWTTQETETSWKLDKPKTILALELGNKIDALKVFLQSKDDQPLPEAVEGFLTTCQKQGQAIKQVAVSLLLECSSEEIAKVLASHKETKKLCQLVGKKQLVVKQSQVEKFQAAARIVGFGMVL